MAKQTNRSKLEEARRRWGKARIYTGHPAPKQTTPPPMAPAVAAQTRRAA